MTYSTLRARILKKNIPTRSWHKLLGIGDATMGLTGGSPEYPNFALLFSGPRSPSCSTPVHVHNTVFWDKNGGPDEPSSALGVGLLEKGSFENVRHLSILEILANLEILVALKVRRQNPGPFLGTTKDTKTAFVAHWRPTQGGLNWLNLA